MPTNAESYANIQSLLSKINADPAKPVILRGPVAKDLIQAILNVR